LIIRKQIKIADFTFEEGRCRISDKARKKLIAQILKRLDSYVKFNGRNISFSDVIVFQARLMTKFLVGEVEYKGFYLRW
jgi:CRISPR-associated protein Cas1